MKQIEKQIIVWLKPVPRLPRYITKLIADNLWWVIIIATIVMTISALASLLAISSYLSYLGNAASYAGIYNTALYSGLWLFFTVLSLIFSSLIAYIYYRSITPLRKMHELGWRLLFGVFLISVLRAAIFSFTTLNVFVIIFTLIFSAIFMAVGAYLLFEIRHYFVKN